MCLQWWRWGSCWEHRSVCQVGLQQHYFVGGFHHNSDWIDSLRFFGSGDVRKDWVFGKGDRWCESNHVDLDSCCHIYCYFGSKWQKFQVVVFRCMVFGWPSCRFSHPCLWKYDIHWDHKNSFPAIKADPSGSWSQWVPDLRIKIVIFLWFTHQYLIYYDQYTLKDLDSGGSFLGHFDYLKYFSH